MTASLPPLAFRYRFRAPGSPAKGPIRHACGLSTMGSVLVGQSERGICAIFLGDDGPALRRQLAAAFPGTALQADALGLEHELRQVIALIDGNPCEASLDLDIGGTPFQQGVWRALCGIPAGQTRSYRDLALQLGVPQAIRAVGGACAANVLAIAIPCHRILRSDGTISGYRWGADRKRALLAREGAH